MSTRYKVLATLSDADTEVAVCMPGTKQVGVPMEDVMMGRFDTYPVASAEMNRLYDAHIRGFRLDTDFARIAEGVPAERRFNADDYDGPPPMYGVVAYTADDINRTMGGRFVAPPSTATQVLHTTYGDVLLAGYPSAVVRKLSVAAPDDAAADAEVVPPVLVNNKIHRRLNRIRSTTTAASHRLLLRTTAAAT